MSNTEENKKYKGPNKFEAVVGSASVESALGGLIGIAATLGISGDARSAVKHELLGRKGLMEQNVFLETLGGEGGFEAGLAKVNGGAKKLAFTLGALTVIGALHGIYRAWTNVDAAKEQVADLNKDLEITKASLAEQKNFVETLRKEREQGAHAAQFGHSKA